MPEASWLLFVLASLVVITPGQDMILVMSRSVAQGPSAGVATAAGVSAGLVAYDNMGFPLGSARLWWALSYYGHDRVRVLDGGLREWVAEGRPVVTEVPAPAPATFTPRVRPEWKASKEDVLVAIGQAGTTIVDCLTPELYRGGGHRHLWGQRSGHIPGR